MTIFISQQDIQKFEPGLLGVSCGFNTEHYQDQLFQQFQVVLPEKIEQASNKRKAEYLAGRYCAQKAQASFDGKTRNIGTGPQRQPIWPEHLCGSISHTAKRAICLMATKTQVLSIGVDIEEWINPKQVPNIHTLVINNTESQLLKQLPLPFSNAFTVIFSAKESVFKALYPEVKILFDFSAVVLISVHQYHVVLQLKQTLSESFTTGLKLQVYFKVDDSHCITWLAIKNSALETTSD